MNNTIVEYINGMEVVKVFNRDGESYHRFETDVKTTVILLWIGSGLAGCGWPSTPAFCPAWRWCCCRPAAIWYSPAPLPCRITRWYCACLFPWDPPLIRAMNFMSVLPQLSYKIDQMESLFNIPPLKEGKNGFQRKRFADPL